MNVKFLNPFITSAHEIISFEMDEPVERGELRLENGLYVTEDVTVILSLIGAVTGTVLFSMSDQCAIQLASALMGEKFHALDKLAQSGIAELGNVITGRATMKFAETGYDSKISTPSLILGQGATLSTLEFPRLIVPLHMSKGSITIHLALREGFQADRKAGQRSVSKPFDS